MFTALQIAAGLSILCEPLLPFTAQKMKKMLQLEAPWKAVSGDQFLLPQGHNIQTPQLLFDKIEEEAIAQQLQKLKNTLMLNQY